ncbi:minor capsid protein [Macrococcoides canis]|uniref:minor capsid protein n=1 Tax=Macrococcoides canis TaxID=1855823 RepID=UPI001F26E13B|nr:minor capsid protein [Macrococcus canis]UJS28485.1 minor capsid protein [Macrococcus canis]
MKLDLLERLNDHINTLELYTKSKIGVLDTEDSIALMAMPGGDETVYFDGTRDKVQNVQVTAKGTNQQSVLDSLITIYQDLENLFALDSLNNSYEFQHITTASYPSLILVDEQGHFIYELTIAVHITTYQGVI